MASSSEITALLIEWTNGDRSALDRLMPIVEKELKRIARIYLRDFRRFDSMQPTVLINETYIRLVDQTRVKWQNRAHFFAIAATMMQRVLKNYLRRRRQKKRGGGMPVYSPTEIPIPDEAKSKEILNLEAGLEKLLELDPRKYKMVVMRYYGGLSVLETAHVLGISEATVMRDWRFVRSWMYREFLNAE